MLRLCFLLLLGGKDSLVVWNRIKLSDAEPVLLYCSATLYEFETNYRIQKLVELTESSIILGTAVLRIHFYQ